MWHDSRPPLSNGRKVAVGGGRPEATGIWAPAADLRPRPPILMHPEVRTTNPAPPNPGKEPLPAPAFTPQPPLIISLLAPQVSPSLWHAEPGRQRAGPCGRRQNPCIITRWSSDQNPCQRGHTFPLQRTCPAQHNQPRRSPQPASPRPRLTPSSPNR